MIEINARAAGKPASESNPRYSLWALPFSPRFELSLVLRYDAWYGAY